MTGIEALEKILSRDQDAKNTFSHLDDEYIIKALRIAAKGYLIKQDAESIKGVVKGLSNCEISETLLLSEGTVRNYISIILDKLERGDRTQLAIFYYNHK